MISAAAVGYDARIASSGISINPTENPVHLICV